MFKIEKRIKLNEINAQEKWEFDVIAKKNKHFVDVQYRVIDNMLILNFTSNEGNLLNGVKLTNVEKLIVLSNVLKLEVYSKDYSFSLDTNNIVVLPDLSVKILNRDINKTGNTFISKWKSLFGSLFMDKLTYNDILKGGMDLLLNNKYTALFYNIEKVCDIETELNNLISKEREKRDTNFVIVNKNKYKKNKLSTKVFAFLMVVFAILSLSLVKTINYERNVNSIQENYVRSEYSSVIEVSKKVKVNSMSDETLYVVARSFIETENIEKDAKNNLLKKVTINSDPELLKFWVYLSRNDYNQAIDISYNINDKDFLVYAYLKQIDFVEEDSKLSTDEKSSKVKELEQKIKELGYTIKGE